MKSSIILKAPPIVFVSYDLDLPYAFISPSLHATSLSSSAVDIELSDVVMAGCAC